MKKIEDPGGRRPSLKHIWTGNCDILVFSPGNLKHLEALRKAYADLYLPLFPPGEGYDSLEQWIDSLNDPNSPVEYRISVAGDNLRKDDGSAIVKGICVSAYFKDSDTGYLGYIVVDPKCRTEGLGYALFKQHESSMIEAARVNGGALRGLFLDCNDPDNPHQDAYDPQKRVEKYQKWGGRRVPIDYKLPLALNPVERVDNLTLIAFRHPVTGKYPDGQTIQGFLGSIFKDNGVGEPEKDAGFQAMTRNLKAKARHEPRRSPAYPRRKQP